MGENSCSKCHSRTEFCNHHPSRTSHDLQIQPALSEYVSTNPLIRLSKFLWSPVPLINSKTYNQLPSSSTYFCSHLPNNADWTDKERLTWFELCFSSLLTWFFLLYVWYLHLHVQEKVTQEGGYWIAWYTLLVPLQLKLLRQLVS